jgi:hypothetical protein
MANYLLACADCPSLEAIVTKVSVLLDVNFTERFSDHYVDGHYFVTDFLGASLTLSLSNEMDHTDLPYWLHITSDAADETVDSQMDIIIKQRFLPAQIRVAKFNHFGRVDETRIDFK